MGNTDKLDAAWDAAQAAKAEKPFVPSKYQQEIFHFIEKEKGNGTVEAVAGSGKTSTLVKALSIVRDRNPLFCAFNKHIADELKSRVPQGVNVSTIHSLGFSALRKTQANMEVDGKKLQKIASDVMGDDFDYREARAAAVRLASLCKLTLTDPSDVGGLQALIDRYDVDTNGDEEWIIDCVPDLLKADREDLGVIDFDDMIWLPHVLNLQPRRHDVVFVDEAQDLNAAQRELVIRAAGQRGRIIAVGDRFQAIYGFAGADTESIPTLIKTLKATVLPLSICYRCPASHIALAKEIVPQIEGRENAPQGVVEDIEYQQMMKLAQDGDLIISRINRPLAGIAMEFIRAGRKACLRGRDLSSGLLALIRRAGRGAGDDLTKWMDRAETYCQREVAKLRKADKEAQAESLRDRVETLYVLSDGLQTVKGLEDRVNSIFSDESTSGIVCSSVHRAKGLEAKRVIVVGPELMPFPLARKPWEIEQEMNLKYVSLTRAKECLYFTPDPTRRK